MKLLLLCVAALAAVSCAAGAAGRDEGMLGSVEGFNVPEAGGLRRRKLSASYKNSPGLTTSGSNIVRINSPSTKVHIHGLAWYGSNVGQYGNFLGGPTEGSNSLTKDVRTVLWRIKQLGFNAVRLGFAFSTLNAGVGVHPGACSVASQQAVINSVLYPGFGARIPYTKPPAINGGVCNSGMPTSSPFNQFVWAVAQAAKMGLYVSLDFHSNSGGDQTFYSPTSFIQNWERLLKAVKGQKGTYGRIMLDVVNEPDGYACSWQTCKGWGTLTSVYTRTWSALHKICPECLLLAEGSGQYNGWANYGDGFTTNQQVIAYVRKFIAAKGKYFYADASPFFKAIHSASYRKQIVLSPHIYCPAVTGASDHYAGAGLWWRLQNSFGDKQSRGYTYKGTTVKYPVINGEFGSTYDSKTEQICMRDIFKYMNNQAPGYSHPAITSYFYWDWNPDSEGTGGILNNDWTTISWNKITELSQHAGLVPWYKYSPHG